jgi:DNA-binding NarL/FixJ family response regulator
MRVLIVDDHPLFRTGLKALLFELDPAIETAEATSVSDVILAGERGEAFDLVLLDLDLPDSKGLSGLQRVRAAFEGPRLVVMSALEDADLIRSAIDAGACGYIPKTTDPTVTVHALRLVLARGIYLPPHVLDAGGDRGARDPAARNAERPQLSTRQLAVLQRLLQGKPNKIIARELLIAEGTVKAYLAAIYQALNVSSRTQAMFRAHELGFFDQFPGAPGG